jgi:hypothetical protein
MVIAEMQVFPFFMTDANLSLLLSAGKVLIKIHFISHDLSYNLPIG